MNLPKLLGNILETHRWFSTQAARQINTALTLRNWLIGMYLFEYEQKGQDRAQYGDRLYDEISVRLKRKGLKGFSRRSLYHHKDFYLIYPQIVQSVTAQLQEIDNQGLLSSILLMSEAKNTNLETQGLLHAPVHNDPNILLNRLTYTHFVELLKCDTALQRTFYETESIANN